MTSLAPRPALLALVTLTGLTGLAGLAPAPARAQEARDPADPERVFVPEEAWGALLKRYPQGVLTDDASLRQLIERARKNRQASRAVPREQTPPPVTAVVERLRVAGQVTGEVAELEAEAEVAVLRTGTVRLPIPLSGVGLTGAWVDGVPARAIVTRRGPELLLDGLRPDEQTGTRVVRWQMSIRTQPGDEAGSGRLDVPVPAASAGSVRLVVAGDLEASCSAGSAWSTRRGEQSELRVAFGGVQRTSLRLDWHPRRRVVTVTPYLAVDARTVLRVRRAGATLEATAELDVLRAARDRLELLLPAGFVVRKLELSPGDESFVQRGDRVEVRLAAPREGRLTLALTAELAQDGAAAGEDGLALALRPIRFGDADRTAGVLAIAAADDARVEVGQAAGLARADAAAIGRPVTGLVRAYRETGAAEASLAVTARPVQAVVSARVLAALELHPREVRALALTRFAVDAGRVYRVTASLPADYAVDRVLVRDPAGREPAHELHEATADGRTELTVTLERALGPGDALLITAFAVREVPKGVGGSAFAIPRFGASPAASVRGYLGFVPDSAFRLAGQDLKALVPIPAAELPKAGLEVEGLVLGYRVDDGGYAGTIAVGGKETRISVSGIAHHQVVERTIVSDVALRLEIGGAPIETIDLLLPPGTGQRARIDGAPLRADRERVGVAEDGRERWRLRFVRRQEGAVDLRVRLRTPLTNGGEQDVLSGAVPQVGVADAFRERGTVAIYSADAVELTAQPVGLRAVEGTDLPEHPFGGLRGDADEQPLFAFRNPGPAWGLTLTARRHTTAPVISAVVEELAVETSAGPDGVARHEARFTVQSLADQFFVLRLPGQAKLWSVTVDGEGVKPAADGDLCVVPLPNAGEKAPGEATVVVVTYTDQGQRWGALTTAELNAPALLQSATADAPLPVLRTRWSVALPDDYRVLDTWGNLDPEAPGATVKPIGLVAATWNRLPDAAYGLGLFALLALAVGASRRARLALLHVLFAGERAAGAVSGQAARKVVIGGVVACLLGACCLGVLLPATMSARGGMRPMADAVSMEQAQKMAAPGGAVGDGGAWSEREEVLRREVMSSEGRAFDASPDDFESGEANFATPMEPEPEPPAEMAEDGAFSYDDEDAEGGEGFESMAEEPVILEEEVEATEDVPKGTDLGPLRQELERALGAEQKERSRRSKDKAEERAGGKKQRPQRARPSRAPKAPPAPSTSEPMPGDRQRGYADDPNASVPTPAPRPTGGVVASGEELDLDLPALDAGDDSVVDTYGVGGGASGGAGGVLRFDGKGDAGRKNGGQVELGTLLDAIGEQVGRNIVVDGAKRNATVDLSSLQGLAWRDALDVLAHQQGLQVEEGKGGVLVLGAAVKTQSLVPTLAAGGQVGLRSLVLDLVAVGRQFAFARSGGGARLTLRAVHEPSLLTLTAFLALIGFALGLAARQAGAAYLGVLAVGLGVASAAPVLIGPGLVAVALNGLLLGLLLTVPVVATIAFAGAWASAPFTRLGKALAALREQRRAARAARRPAGGAGGSGGGSGAAAALLIAAALLAPTSAQAGEPDAPEPAGPRVFVPYDADHPETLEGDGPRKVFVPRDLYERIWRQAFPEQVAPVVPKPAAPAVVTDVAYAGELTSDGLALEAEVKVEVLAAGWQRIPLGLSGVGLEDSAVHGPTPDARVVPLASGGYELIAQGPGSFRLGLRLLVPQGIRGYTFQAVPTLVARLAVRAPQDGGRRLVVTGARAQLERQVDGALVVAAALGDAPQVGLQWRAREVLSAGASEASAETRSVVRVRRGFLETVSETTFSVSGEGREGFVFDAPEALAITRVQLVDQPRALRGWRREGRRLEVELRRPLTGQVRVRVWGEQRLAPDATTFAAPAIAARGVNHETGAIGVAAGPDLRLRPATTDGLRQVERGRVRALAALLGRAEVERAYGFTRRPFTLGLERVDEAPVANANVRVRAQVAANRYEVEALVRYDVRRGALYALELAFPKALELLEATPGRGLDVRGTDQRTDGEARILRLDLGTGLRGSGQVTLRLARRLALDQGAVGLPFPEVRARGVAQESGAVAIAADPRLELRAPRAPADVEARDVQSLTRGWPRFAAAPWQLGYQWGAGKRAAALATTTLAVKRPKAYVTGAWVLHAQVEQDVVRYTLRALYEIERAGARRFEVVLPSATAARAVVTAENQREVARIPDGDRTRLVVDLQSPAEVFYDLAVTWEELLTPGTPFSIPAVDVVGVDRKVRGFVLVEKAPAVADDLVERSRSGPVADGRAANAPALPPGRGPRDFVRVYRVPLKDEPWQVTCELVARAVRLPPPARITTARIESVVVPEGHVRHRVRYNLTNLRLQFLPLRLPAGAEVWSVHVADRPKRLHAEGDLALIPLPKRTDADRAFEVELVYTTPSLGALERRSVGLVAPELALDDQEVEVEKTFWTLYLPPGLDYRGFQGPGLQSSSVEAMQVATYTDAVQELKRLEEVARTGRGGQQALADTNVERQLLTCNEALLGLVGPIKGRHRSSGSRLPSELERLIAGNTNEVQALQAEIERRRADVQAKQRELEAQQAQQTYDVEGNVFEQTASGWATNRSVFKKGAQVQWSNVEDEAQREQGQQAFHGVQQGAGQQAQQAQQDYSLNVQGKLALENAEVVTRDARQRGARRGLLQNRLVPEVQQAEGPGGPAPSQVGKELADGTLAGHDAGGRLSIRVAFPTPGIGYSFVTETAEAPRVQFAAAAADAGAGLGRLLQAAGLVLLLAGLIRLGLLRPLEGRGAGQALALIAACAVGALAIASPLGAALAAAVGLLALRHGPIGAPAG